MSANDVQIDGDHYKDFGTGVCPHCGGKIEHWDWAGDLPGLEYAATKYIARWPRKAGLQSLLKAVHYVAKRVERAFPGKVLYFELRDVPAPPEPPKVSVPRRQGKARL